MNNKTQEKGSNIMKIAMIGAGITSVAAAAYFFLGSKGEEHKKHLKAWAIKMKGDIIEKIEEAKDVNEDTYHKIIDNIATEYKKGAKASSSEIDELAKDLKKHWKTIRDSAQEIKDDVKEDIKKQKKANKIRVKKA